jgi:hypothetical protein
VTTEIAVRSSWKAWLKAPTLEGAERVSQRLFTAMGHPIESRQVERYEQGGFVVRWACEHPPQPWEDLVVDVLRHAQQLAHGFQLLGSIDDEVSVVASQASGAHFMVPGVTMLSCDAVRERTLPYA